MSIVKLGDKVTLRYLAKYQDELIYDSSDRKEPLNITVGKHEILPILENALIGMKKGQSKIVPLEAEKAFGEYIQELVQTVDRSLFPQNLPLEKGQQVELLNEHQEPTYATIIDFSPKTVTLDANHPFAGKDLTFDLEVIEIQ